MPSITINDLVFVFCEEADNQLNVEFASRISRATSDYIVFASSYEPANRDKMEKKQLTSIFDTLLASNDSGVECVRVRPYVLEITFSRATHTEAIEDLVKEAIQKS